MRAPFPLIFLARIGGRAQKCAGAFTFRRVRMTAKRAQCAGILVPFSPPGLPLWVDAPLPALL